MKNQILVKRYTQGLVNSIKSEKEFRALYEELTDFSQLTSTHEELKEILLSPFIPKSKKREIVEELLAKKAFGEKASRFVLLLLENNRFDLLHDILDSLPELWNEERGILTFEVASVVPLKEDQKEKIQEKLELLEKKPVVLKYRIDPDLIGGLWIKKGNIVYDTSIRGHLLKLKERICEE
ncbi:MAG: ATP synthase F1 subunit delta [Candidatus Aminicenantes bacterium]|nr:MAG: ATP synthase F1 subunit delta [Candidatus Aminicenantes bacterium]